MPRRLLEATLTGGDQPLKEGESFQMLVIGLGAAAIGFVVGRDVPRRCHRSCDG
jgi:hypothetical protein